MSIENDVLSTFKSRSQSYDKDMTWLDKSRLITPMIPQPFGSKKALDVCTGTGILAKRLYDNGWNVVASDISAEMLDKVGDYAEHLLADVCDLPFDENTFDLVVCRQGLQYVDVEKALVSLRRVSKDEVRIGHVTMNDSVDYDFWRDYHVQASPGRKEVFIPGETEKLIRSVGLHIIEEHILYDQSEITPPLLYLPEDQRSVLINSILSTSDAFKKRNGIKMLNGEMLVRERRWEFFICKKE